MINLTSIKKASAAGAALLVATVAQAAPIVYDFTGVGNVCSGTCYTGNFYGTITIDVIAPGPAGDDAIVYEDIGYNSDPSGWVNSSYQINWDEGSFTPGAFAGAAGIGQGAIVVNGLNDDWLQTSASFEAPYDPSFIHWDSAMFTRYSPDTSWLSDNTFRTDLGLASGPGTYNELFFQSYFINWFEGVPLQMRGVVEVQTLVARPTTPVPEPSTLALLALGMLGACFVLRRRERIR